MMTVKNKKTAATNICGFSTFGDVQRFTSEGPGTLALLSVEDWMR